MKKILSMLLSISIVMSCMFTLSLPVSAEISIDNTQDFSSLAQADDVKTALTTLTTLPWTTVEPGATYTVENRGDSNGTALKWSTTTTSTDAGWSFATIPVGLDLTANDAVGTESWMSFDFKMEGTGVSRQFGFYNYNNSNWATAPFFDVVQGATTPSYKFNNTVTAARQNRTVVDNGWHTLKICVKKTGDATSTASFILDDQYMCEANVTSLLPFNRVLIRQGDNTGYTPGSGSMSLDNIKAWKDTAPAAQEKVLYKFESAADWGTAPTGTSITDVPGSNGKYSSDTVVKLSAPAAGSTVSANKQVALSNVIPSEDYDVLIDFDMRACDYNWTRYLMFYKGGTGSSIQIKDGKITYYSWHNNPATGRNVMPVNQWNHYTIRISNDNTYKLYVNGVLENGHVCATGYVGSINWFTKYEGTAAAGEYPEFADEMDNYTISLCPVSTSEARCKTKPRVYRNFDFTNIVAGGGYNVTNGSGTSVAASDGFFNNGNLNTVDNIVGGKYGKTSNDKVMAYSATTPAVYTVYAYQNPAYSPENLVAGSTVRGGVSVLYEKDSYRGRDTIFQLKLNPSTYTTANAVVQAQPLVGVKSGGKVYYKAAPNQDAVEVDAVIGANKWYRIEYVLNVGDATTGKAGTVDFYLDGKLLNNEPIDVVYWYDSSNTQDLTSPVGKCSLEVEDQDDGECFYLDDFTVEYIPEGLDDNSDITKNLALVSEAENVEMSNAGVINLMDAADSAITVENFVSKLDAAVTTIDANGAAVSGSALASGTYAVLDRGIWPDICYMASDLNVTAEDGEVCAYMPYSKDRTSAVIVAIYDDDDRLIASDIDTSDDGVLSVSLPSEGGHSYKVFLWNSIDSMKPYYGNAQGNIL